MTMWPDLSSRCRQPEQMDDPSLPKRQHEQALRGLDRLQVISRTAARLWDAAKRRTDAAELRWLDVACGSGRVVNDIRRRSAADGVRVDPIRIDFSATAIKTASLRGGVGVVADARAIPLADGAVDVASCTLFLHHLEAADVVAVLREMARVSKLVVVDDLRRTRTGHLLAHLAGRLFSRSPIVHFDGPISVESAFTTDELRSLAGEAGLTNVDSRQQWPQRTVLTSASS